MQKISGYITNVLLIISALCNAQDTIRFPINEMKGVRLGIDVSTVPFMIATNLERIGFGLSADMHIKGNFFGVAETGWMKVNLEKSNYRYDTEGYYGRLGIDYNLLKPRRPNSNDIFYAGLRYCYATFNHKAQNITVPGYFWRPDATELSMPITALDAQWLELLLGVKTELLKNFYISLTFRLKFLLITPKDNFSTPYLIPGFGNGDSNTVVGINYFLSYNIFF